MHLYRAFGFRFPEDRVAAGVGMGLNVSEAPNVPADMRLVLDASVRRIDRGRVLIGGSPIRIVRLTVAGAALVDRLVAGEAVGQSSVARRLVRRLLDGGLAHPRWQSSPFTVDDVTLVIPAFGRADSLRTTLDALAADPSGPTRVLVVDDGSPEPASIVRVTDEAGAKLVRREVNGGPGAARNTGLAHVTTPVVAFVDVDVVPPPGWLEDLLAHFSDPLVAAVAPRIVARSVRAVASGGAGRDRLDEQDGLDGLARFEQDRSPLDLGPAQARVAPRTRVAYVPTTMLVVRSEVIDALGGFDEDLTFGEDVDLVWRLVEAGHRVRYEPSVVVTHPTRPDFAAWLRQRFDYGRSAAPLAQRHSGALAPVSVSVWSATAWGLAAAGFPLVGGVVAGAAIAQLPARLRGLERPWAEGLRLAGGGTWAAWRPLSSAVSRTWWPAGLAAALVSKRARRAMVAAVVIPPLVDWWQGERSVDPVRYLALRVADDLAYGAGVWAGCLQHRTAEPLRPDLRSWPGRTPAVEPT